MLYLVRLGPNGQPPPAESNETPELQRVSMGEEEVYGAILLPPPIHCYHPPHDYQGWTASWKLTRGV